VRSVAFLSLSGAIGIGFGDTAYFASLNCVGARRALLLEALAPPLTALFAGVFLGEILPPSAWLGIALTVVGVAWVVLPWVVGVVKSVEKKKSVVGQFAVKYNPEKLITQTRTGYFLLL
jgi:drug/metabolite transporter (DMT)-like permease